jgi:type I restriction enzyme M protein
MPARSKSATQKDSTDTIGFEAKSWLATDGRSAAKAAGVNRSNNIDAAKAQRGGAEQYNHVVLDRIFLKYLSGNFEEHRAKILAGEGDYTGAAREDPDEYKADNVFCVAANARWSHLQANAKQPSIGKAVDDAMVAIERDNPRIKGVLPKDHARPSLDKHR